MGLDVAEEPAGATSPRRVRFGGHHGHSFNGKTQSVVVDGPTAIATGLSSTKRCLQVATRNSAVHSGGAVKAADDMEPIGGQERKGLDRWKSLPSEDDELTATLAAQVGRGLQLLCGSPRASSLSLTSGKRFSRRGAARRGQQQPEDQPASMKAFLRKYQRKRDAGDVERRDSATDLLTYSRQLLKHIGSHGFSCSVEAQPARGAIYLPITEAERQVHALRELLVAAEAEVEAEATSPTVVATEPAAHTFPRFQVDCLRRRIAELELLALLPSAADPLPPDLCVEPVDEADPLERNPFQA
eukprot:GGOE01041590.1.p1 GENE.GGOE01041590.1~~GGOE01041590.1.p1  ORF type:complete len:300 (+),score=55.20 GGOE01041590.1:105-1004(+)